MTVDIQKLHDLVCDSCALLDEKQFDAWIALTAPEFHYRLVAFSEELGKDMVWMDFSRDALKTLMERAGDHEQNLVRYSRHVATVRIGQARADGLLPIRSALTVYYTDLEGTTGLYAIGAYRDRVKLVGNAPLLAEREVSLTTRRLPFGCHYPL